MHAWPTETFSSSRLNIGIAPGTYITCVCHLGKNPITYWCSRMCTHLRDDIRDNTSCSTVLKNMAGCAGTWHKTARHNHAAQNVNNSYSCQLRHQMWNAADICVLFNTHSDIFSHVHICQRRSLRRYFLCCQPKNNDHMCWSISQHIRKHGFSLNCPQVRPCSAVRTLSKFCRYMCTF